MKLSYLIGVSALSLSLASCARFSSHRLEKVSELEKPISVVSSNNIDYYSPTNDSFLINSVQDSSSKGHLLKYEEIAKQVEENLARAKTNFVFKELPKYSNSVPIKKDKKSNKWVFGEIVLAGLVVYGGYRYYTRGAK